jgi:hypothetical protein
MARHELKQGQIVQYLGEEHRADGMEGIIIGLARIGPPRTYLMRLPWMREPQHLEVAPSQVRKLRWFSASFTKRYPHVEAFAKEWGVKRPERRSRPSRRSR